MRSQPHFHGAIWKESVVAEVTTIMKIVAFVRYEKRESLIGIGIQDRGFLLCLHL